MNNGEGIFGLGREKHTKETYSDAGHNLHEAARLKRELYQSPDFVQLYSVITRNAEKAKSRINSLYEKGQTEANALNEEYDRLMASTLESVKALQAFEKNKLGMSEETVH